MYALVNVTDSLENHQHQQSPQRSRSASVHATKQVDISLGEATGFKDEEDGSMVHSIERIPNVQIEKDRGALLQAALLSQHTVHLEQLSLGAPTWTKPFLNVIA